MWVAFFVRFSCENYSNTLNGAITKKKDSLRQLVSMKNGEIRGIREDQKNLTILQT